MADGFGALAACRRPAVGLLVAALALVLLPFGLPSGAVADGHRAPVAARDAVGPARTSGHLTVIQHNVSGAQSNRGLPRALLAVNRRIGEARPDVVVLNEVCAAQYRAFARRHRSWHVAFDSTNVRPFGFSSRGRFVGCGRAGTPDAVIGEVVASPHPMRRLGDFCVAQKRVSNGLYGIRDCRIDVAADRQAASVTCYAIEPAGRRARSEPTVACATHLEAKASNRMRRLQFERIKQVLGRYVSSGALVVFAGDLNTVPQNKSLGSLYSVSAKGEMKDGEGLFTEGDQEDPANFTRRKPKAILCQRLPVRCRWGDATEIGAASDKIDYVFFSADSVRQGSVDLHTYLPPLNPDTDLMGRHGRYLSEHRVLVAHARRS